MAYTLVCYVNILSGLLTSKNYEGVEVQTGRIKTFLASGGDKYVTPAYVSLVSEFVACVEEFVASAESMASDNH